MIPTRRIVVLIVALALLAPPPSSWAQGGDDAAVAVNTKDGSQLFRFSFNVRRIMGDVVDTSNAAVAFASCESCQTVAISIQLVLVSGSPDVVTPENLAIAINQECVSCETLASAYQFVFGVGAAPVHFTSEGSRTLAELRLELTRLKNEDLSIDEIQGKVEGIVDRLRLVLANELVAAPRPEDNEEPSPTTTHEPEPTTEVQPTEPPPTTTAPPPTESSPTTTETEPQPTTETTTTTETEPPPPTETTTEPGP